MSPQSQPNSLDDLGFRMQELADPLTPWFRALWGVGSVVALKEVAEAATARWEGVLTGDGALNDFKANIVNHVPRDVGLGSSATRARITESVSKIDNKPNNDGRTALAELQQLIERADRRYVWRWAEAAEAGAVAVEDGEYVARSVISHLLDAGLHQQHILGWLRSRDDQSLAALLRDASQMLTQRPTRYRFAIAFKKVPRPARSNLLRGRNFTLDAYRAAYEAAENRAGAPDLDLDMGWAVELEFEAMDPFTALDQARAWLARFSVRAALGTGGSKVEHAPLVIDLEARKIRDLTVPGLVKVDVIGRRRMFTDITNSPITLQIDDALAMLAPQLQSTSGISVAALWAACEGLLGRVDSGGPDVADRLADIVACTFPRNDVFELVKRWERHGSGLLRDRLLADSSNYRKILMFCDAMRGDEAPAFATPEDRLAIERVRAVLAQPDAYISRVRRYLRATFRRLYYQRNFIMHSARFDSVSLASTARVAPDLVAAALEQIINGRFQHPPAEPLGLAARAANEIALLGTDGAKHPATLLAL